MFQGLNVSGSDQCPVFQGLTSVPVSGFDQCPVFWDLTSVPVSGSDQCPVFRDLTSVLCFRVSPVSLFQGLTSVLCFRVSPVSCVSGSHQCPVFQCLTSVPVSGSHQCPVFQGLTRESLERYQVRGTPDQDGLVLPAVSVDGTIVGVKSIILQTVKSGDTEKTRVVTRFSSRSVSPRVINVNRLNDMFVVTVICTLSCDHGSFHIVMTTVTFSMQIFLNELFHISII